MKLKSFPPTVVGVDQSFGLQHSLLVALQEEILGKHPSEFREYGVGALNEDIVSEELERGEQLFVLRLFNRVLKRLQMRNQGIRLHLCEVLILRLKRLRPKN